VSFAVRPDERVEQLFLAATDLSGSVGSIPRSQVLVQSVEGFHGSDKDILMDLGQAWDMPAFQRELFWATVHVPAETKPGEYTGEVTVTGGGKPIARLMLQLEVLPFRLEQPPFALGYNYSSPKDPRSLAAHLEDMRAHGLTTVAPLYDFHLPVQDDDTTEFGEFLAAFRRAGVRQPLYFGTSMNLLMSELAGYGPVDSRRFQRKFLQVEWYYNLGPIERGSIVRTEGGRIWPTLAYERSREGIDDLKYLVTLERRIATAKSSGREPEAVSRAEALLQRIADGIVDNWTAYTDGGETFPGDGFDLLSADKSAGLTHYQSVRRALADAILELQPGGSTP
jgi:hypothetical protein